MTFYFYLQLLFAASRSLGRQSELSHAAFYFRAIL